MKRLLILCALAALACPQLRAMQNGDLADAISSTDTIKGDEAPDEEEFPQAYIQESDEDLSGFVQDYVKKDVYLKGAFFLEDHASGKILKLSLAIAPKRSSNGPNNTKVLEAIFKDAAGKSYPVLFHIQSVGFGGIDIFRIDLKNAAKPGQAKPGKNSEVK